MAKNMIKFINAGVYETEEQAREIATVLLMAQALSPSEYTDIIVAIEAHFAPVEAEEAE